MKLYLLFGLLIFSGCLTACGDHYPIPTSPLAPPPTDDAVNLAWLYPEDFPHKTNYEVGESLYHRLSITNRTAEPLELYFIHCQHLLAFDSPLQLHLINPDGTDLLAPYSGALETEIPPQCTTRVQIEPDDLWGEIIDLARWTRPTEPGTYHLWSEYTRPNGQTTRSDVLTFTVHPPSESIPSQPVDVQLAFDRLVYTRDDYPLFPTLTFVNRSDQPLTFLKPQDGSTSRFVNPLYQFTVWDDDQRVLEVIAYDGNIDTPQYNQETMFTVSPGNSYTQPVYMPYFPEMWERPGEYRVQLTYIVRTHAIEWGRVLDEPLNWDKSVLTGVLESDIITLTIK